MSTRAVYTFADDNGVHHVYKHCDGYPSGALGFIQAAKKHAWELPRFEADEFGAAFIAANKRSAGDCRLTNGPETHADIAYRYTIQCVNGKLFISAYEVGYSGDDRQNDKLIFQGTETAMKSYLSRRQRENA